jgi:hypothetical protein
VVLVEPRKLDNTLIEAVFWWIKALDLESARLLYFHFILIEEFRIYCTFNSLVDDHYEDIGTKYQ